MKFDNKYLPILIGGIFALGIFIGSFSGAPSSKSFIAKQNTKDKLNKLIDFIENEYVDDVNTDSIVSLTVNNILAKLDPHSIYIPPSQQAEIAETMKGDFVGIGINFYMFKDSLAVITPLKNGPSAKAGIKAGDRILFANKTKLFGRKLPNDSLFAALKGEVGSQINLTVYRKSEHKKINISVKRDVIPLKSVDAALLLNPTTGYIKINRFAGTTYAEFQTALASLKKQGARSLVVDVRDNGGGYMEEAIAIADEFLKDKTLIVFTKSAKEPTEKTYATEKGNFENGRVFVLINENSASASEILAGAIQDNDRGTIIGRRSFGKGLVQREMDFKDGSAVRLTIARYYTPTGRSIQKSYSHGNEEYFKESDARFSHGELYQKDSIKVVDSLKYKTKKGRIVYGGGGIVPDVFVPLEAEHGTQNVSYLLQSGIVGHFVFEQLDKNRDAFAKLTFAEFQTKINATDLYFNVFQKYLSQNGLDIDLSNYKTLVKRYINAEFGRQLYGDKYYYEMILKDDAMIKAVFKQEKQ